jgi:PAS domain S-box-containing protein
MSMALEWYRILAEGASGMMWLIDAQHRPVYFNRRWLEFTGRTSADRTALNWAEILHPDDVDQYRVSFEHAFAARREFEKECRLRRHDGQYRWVLDHASPIYSSDGTFSGYIGNCIDVGGGHEIAAKRERLRVEELDNDAVIWLTPGGDVSSWNAGAERLQGYRAAEIVGQHFSCFFPLVDLQQGKPERLLAVAASEGRVIDEGWQVRKGGSRIWARVVITGLRDAVGRLSGFANVTHDLTDSRRERLRQDERQQIARDLQDQVEQALFAIGLASSATAATRQIGQDNTSVAQLLAQVHLLATSGAEQLRAAIFASNDAEVVERSLVPRLAKLSADVRQRTGIDTELAVNGRDPALPADVAEALCRAAREALGSIERHSNATAVLLKLDTGPHHVALSIQDDGDRSGRSSPGLLSAGEQVSSLNGRFTCEPNPDGGFVVRMSLPINS